MLSTVSSDFVSTWRSAGDLTLGDIAGSVKVLGTLLAVLAVSACCILAARRADDQQRRQSAKVGPAGQSSTTETRGELAMIEVLYNYHICIVFLQC